MRSVVALALISMTATSVMLLVRPAAAQSAQSYWIYDGKSLSVVQRDPSTVQAKEWAVFYFRKSAPAGTMSQRWGIDTGPSAADVLRKVKANQRFERVYEKWCQCSWGSNTFFNVVAPIALSEPTRGTVMSAEAGSDWKVIHKAMDGVLRYRDIINNAATMAGEPKLPAASGPFADFMKNLHKALDRNLSLYAAMEDYVSGASKQISGALEQIQSTLSEVAQAATAVLQNGKAALNMLPNNSAEYATSITWASPWASNEGRTKSYIAGRKYVEESSSTTSSGDTITEIKQASLADLDLSRAKVSAGKDGKYLLELYCRLDSSGVRYTSCLDRHLTSGEELMTKPSTGIWCDTEAECRAFLNGLLRAAK